MSKTIPIYTPREKIGEENNIEFHNTIVWRSGSGLYFVDALTDADDDWLRLLAIRCDDPDQRERLTSLIKSQQRRWETPKSSFFIGFTPLASASAAAGAIVSTRATPTNEVNQDLQWVDSADQILEKLESHITTTEDRLTAVLFAEITPFEESQKPRLLQGLFQFIERYRFYTDDEIVTAVGAAIRKSGMNMPNTEFEHYAQFFLPTATDTLSPEIELELAKAVGWRLAKSEPLGIGAYPKLEARLSELATDYLTARLILQKNYASIVSHAMIGVALLRGARQEELVDRARELGMDWFRDVLARRFAEIADEHRESNPDRATNLQRLRARLSADLPQRGRHASMASR